MGTKTRTAIEPISVFYFFRLPYGRDRARTDSRFFFFFYYHATEYYTHTRITRNIHNCFSRILQVKVTILDKNDNRPTWPSTPIEYKISEEIPVGSLVATLKATDPDLDSTLTYSIIGDDGHGSPLMVDAYTGNVRVRKPIDRETSPRHVIPVRVSDGVHDTDTSVVFTVSCFNVSSPALIRRNKICPQTSVRSSEIENVSCPGVYAMSSFMMAEIRLIDTSIDSRQERGQ